MRADAGRLLAVQLQIGPQAGKIPAPAGHACEGEKGEEIFTQPAGEKAGERAEKGAIFRSAGNPQEKMHVIGGHGAVIEANALERALAVHEGQEEGPVAIEIPAGAKHQVKGALRAQGAALFAFSGRCKSASVNQELRKKRELVHAQENIARACKDRDFAFFRAEDGNSGLFVKRCQASPGLRPAAPPVAHVPGVVEKFLDRGSRF